MSGTAHSTWTPCQVASRAPPGSSPVCFRSVSCKPGLTGTKLRCLGQFLPAQVLSHTPRFCVWLSLLSLCGAGSFSFACLFHLSLDLSSGMIFSISVCVKKEVKEFHAGCRTPHGSSETIRQQIEELNCMQHQTRFSTLLSLRSLCGCTSLCLPCRASKSVSSHPLAWLKVARKTHVSHWTRSFTFSINKCVKASVRQLSGLAVFWIFVGLPFTHFYP